ncbi:DUF6431 domain-containing protein [Bhargavaea ullalensis]|uniref:DUF6431 domain-containing protein n=1 Tax=Bhargavaea ullalensis TaxID=1265685 RepID=UPI0035E90B0C
MPCPACDAVAYQVIGSRRRKGKTGDGGERIYSIRRLRCQKCKVIHHELPDCLVPYKRYEAEVIEATIEEPADLADLSDLPVEQSTLLRWRDWFFTLAEHWLSFLRSLARQGRMNLSVNGLSDRSQPVRQRIGQLVGDAGGWLARLVRPLANHHYWLHTRSACLSGRG